jgi:predicted dehydrogenase
MATIRIGVIGAGVLGSFHIGKCLKNPEVSVVGFFDSDPVKRKTVGEKFSVPAFGDTASLLSGCDAAIIATPSSTHCEIALQSLAAGVHLLIEKPLAASYDQGVEIVRAAVKAGVVLHVGHSEAHSAAFGRLLALRPAPRFIEIHRRILRAARTCRSFLTSWCTIFNSSTGSAGRSRRMIKSQPRAFR